jgi:hypothetical protein
MINPYLRPPLCEPSTDNQKRLQEVMDHYGLTTAEVSA